MRHTARFLTLVLAGCAATAQEAPDTQQSAAQAASAGSSGPLPTQHPDESPLATIDNAREKLSYAMGVELVVRLRWQKVDVDPDLLVKGLQDAFGGDEAKLLLSPREAAMTMRQFQAQRRRGLEHAMGMLSEKNKKAGAEFFAENARKDGVVTRPSGLQYKVLKQGEGRRPTLEDRVQCRYRGTLVDGTEFDSTDERAEPATFALKHSIKGWQEALPLMPVGSRWEVVVPPQLAYGERGSGGIGPNATLVFEVELLSILEGAGEPPGTPSGTEGAEKMTRKGES